MNLIFATGNTNKVIETETILNRRISIVPKEILQNTPPETGISFEENAFIKANYIFQKTGLDCFAEDSGLCVEALNGAPGIYSSRFSSINASNTENNILLLEKLKEHKNRRAYFCSTICFINSEGHYFFEGRVYGNIANEISGTTGFGYDPLFIPDGYKNTFAELGLKIKNELSHRKNALIKLKSFLEKY